MNLPNLPTDSLYKYMAIGGMIFTIFGFYFYFIKIHESALPIADLKKNVEMEAIKMNSLLHQSEILKQSINDAGKNTSGKLISIYLAEMNQIQEKDTALQLARTEIDRELYLINDLEDQKGFARLIALLSSTFGTLLMIFGFIFWYTKIQIYQDEIIKKRSSKLNI
jgi:hypothetical protein